MPHLQVSICQGIGGTLDTIAGTVKRAPPLFCNLGMEWLYRLISNPRRAKRQAVLPIFAWKVIRKGILHRAEAQTRRTARKGRRVLVVAPTLRGRVPARVAL